MKESTYSLTTNNSQDIPPRPIWKAIAERLVFILPPNPDTTSMTVRIRPQNGDDLMAYPNTTLLLSNKRSIDVVVEGVGPGGGRYFFRFSLDSLHCVFSHSF